MKDSNGKKKKKELFTCRYSPEEFTFNEVLQDFILAVKEQSEVFLESLCECSMIKSSWKCNLSEENGDKILDILGRCASY